jgi:hypothetical protein
MPSRAGVRGGDVQIEVFVRCRTYNHAWDEFNPIDLESPSYGWRLSLRCIRCSTERHDTIAFGTGQMLSRRYIYPDGYQTPKGEEKPTKEVFREELFTRLRTQLEQAHGLGQDAPVIPITRKRTSKSTKAVKPAKKVSNG